MLFQRVYDSPENKILHHKKQQRTQEYQFEPKPKARKGENVFTNSCFHPLFNSHCQMLVLSTHLPSGSQGIKLGHLIHLEHAQLCTYAICLSWHCFCPCQHCQGVFCDTCKILSFKIYLYFNFAHRKAYVHVSSGDHRNQETVSKLRKIQLQRAETCLTWVLSTKVVCEANVSS